MVSWTNLDGGQSHQVEADDGSFQSEPLGYFDTNGGTFEHAGSHPYHCALHPSMTASLTVT